MPGSSDISRLIDALGEYYRQEFNSSPATQLEVDQVQMMVRGIVAMEADGLPLLHVQVLDRAQVARDPEGVAYSFIQELKGKRQSYPGFLLE